MPHLSFQQCPASAAATQEPGPQGPLERGDDVGFATQLHAHLTDAQRADLEIGQPGELHLPAGADNRIIGCGRAAQVDQVIAQQP